MIEAREVATGVAVVVTGTTADLHATAAGIMRPHRAGSHLLLGPLGSGPVRRRHLRLRTMVTVEVMVVVVEDTLSPMGMAVDMEPRRLRLVSTMVVVVVVGIRDILSLLLPVATTTAMEADGEDMAAVVVAGATIVVGMAMVVDIDVK